jgi:hypothetical protein
MSSLLKDFGRAVWNLFSQVIPLFIGATVGLYVGSITVPAGFDDLKWKVISTLLGTLSVDKIWSVGRKLEERLVNAVIEKAGQKFDEKLRSLLDNHIMPLSDLLERFSPYFAFHTEHGRLESLLRQAESIQSKAKWIVPLFISHKLSSDFDSSTEIRIPTDAGGYSDIIADLMPFATQSIYMSCPFTPKCWFEMLLKDDRAALDAALTNELSDLQFPAHVRSFLAADVRDIKKRFVILPRGTLTGFFAPENRPALKCFLKFTNSEFGITTRFAYADNLCAECPNPCDLASSDYQIWDRSAIVRWCEHGQDGKPFCRLNLNPDARYTKMFDRCFQKQGRTIASGDIIKMLNKFDSDKGKEIQEVWGVQVNSEGVVNDTPVLCEVESAEGTN